MELIARQLLPSHKIAKKVGTGMLSVPIKDKIKQIVLLNKYTGVG